MSYKILLASNHPSHKCQINVNKNSLGNGTSDCEEYNKRVKQTNYVNNYSINKGEWDEVFEKI